MNSFAKWLMVNELMRMKRSHKEIPCRPKVRLKLDSDVIEYFKSIDEYEDLINDILRKHVDKEIAKESSKALR